MINQPLVTIIVTTFNRSNFLTDCLESIVNQTYTNIEILVIDDGSQYEVGEENKIICSNYNNCTYYYKQNTGQPASRNYGIKKAKGTYISFCDDDDFWVLNKLEKQVAILENNKDYDLVTGSIEYVNKDGTKTGNIKSHRGHNHGTIFNDLLIKNRIESPTPLIRKEVFNKVGYFNPNFTIAEDWEFWRRVSYFYKFYFFDEVLAYVRLHDDNMSSKRNHSVVGRFYLYKKLTDSLLEWGDNKFTLKEIEQIKYIEWCHYRKLYSNKLTSTKKKLTFLAKVGSDIPHILKLYFNYNKKYKIQK